MVSIFGSLSHFLGAMTILSGLGLSQAPHQEKLLLAMMLCWQAAISLKSSESFFPRLPVT